VRTYVRGKGEGGLDGQEGKSDGRRERERERESNITAHTFIGSMGIYWSGY